MATASTVIGSPIQRRRYVKVPETQIVKGIRDRWMAHMAQFDPMVALQEALLKSERLTISRYRWHGWCAVLNRLDTEDVDWANAVSGWGDSPGKALAELAYRWNCLMRCSWDPAAWDLTAIPVWSAARRGGSDAS